MCAPPASSLREPVMDASHQSNPLVRKLESILVLSEDEKDVLRTVSGTIKTVGPRQDLVREGDRPSECCLILEGFAYRYKLTEEGRGRQAPDLLVSHPRRHARPSKSPSRRDGPQPQLAVRVQGDVHPTRD